jgi:NADH:ubiquinone oxidoreductase subunit 6 (subunit J)
VIVAVLFVVLAAVAVVGAGGILVCRRAARCVASFLLCCSALAGLYGILGMDYIAVIQLVTSLCMAGLFLVFLTSEQAAGARMPSALWCAVIALTFLTLTTYAVLHGTLGEPVLGTLPIWAVPGEHLSTLGSELLERYTILLALLALLLLAGILAAAYVIRQGSHARPRGRKE